MVCEGPVFNSPWLLGTEVASVLTQLHGSQASSCSFSLGPALSFALCPCRSPHSAQSPLTSLCPHLAASMSPGLLVSRVPLGRKCSLFFLWHLLPGPWSEGPFLRSRLPQPQAVPPQPHAPLGPSPRPSRPCCKLAELNPVVWLLVSDKSR